MPLALCPENAAATLQHEKPLLHANDGDTKGKFWHQGMEGKTVITLLSLSVAAPNTVQVCVDACRWLTWCQ